jgi:type II secretory pathway predicted ATPase ExeA
VDPFAPTADPAAYIPREVTEKALSQLEHGYRHGRTVQVLSGPPGVGKTLLVHVLAERLGDFRTLYLPYASLGFGELCGWILGLLGEPAGHFPERELLGSARASAALGRPLLLLVDEASSIPLESAEGLAGLVREGDGALRLLLVPIDEARAGRVLAVLARDVAELRVSTPLSLEEAEHYVRTRLVRAGTAFELQRRFDAGLVRRLLRASGGNPQRLQQLSGEVLRGNLTALPGHEAEAVLDAPGRDSTPEIEIDALEALDPRPTAHAGARAAAAASHARFPRDPVAAQGPGTRPTVFATAGPAFATPPESAAAAASAATATRPGAVAVEIAPPAPELPIRPPPGDRLTAHGPPLPSAPAEAPYGPAEPRGTNWAIVIGVNLALLAGAVLGLWVSGFFPPPH